MRRRDRGMALLTVIGIVAVLLVLALSFSTAVRTETRLTAGALGRTQAAWLAEAGIQRAYVELRDNPTGFTALHENAAENEALVLDIDSTTEEALGLERGRFEVQAFDESARVNLNTADEDLLNTLLASEPQLVNTLLDWRDEDAESREEGAEGDYYQGLESPYSARDDWFDTLDELLLLKDVAPERVLRLEDLSPVSGPPDPTVEQTATPLGDIFTVYSNDENLDLAGQERLNVQTATAEELNEALQDVLTPEEIQSIVQYRDGGGAAAGEAADGQGQVPAGSDPVAAAAAALTPPGASATPAAPAAAEGAEAPGGAPAEDEEAARRPRTVAELVNVIGREKLQQVYDRLTVSADPLQLGLINLNTAPLEILASLPGMDLTLAQAIVDARRQEPFETVGDLLRLSEVTDELFGQLAPLLTTRSAAFRLQASGTVGEGEQAITRRIVAVVLVETTAAAAPTAADSAAATNTAVDESTAATATDGPQRRLRLVYRKME